MLLFIHKALADLHTSFIKSRKKFVQLIQVELDLNDDLNDVDIFYKINKKHYIKPLRSQPKFCYFPFAICRSLFVGEIFCHL